MTPFPGSEKNAEEKRGRRGKLHFLVGFRPSSSVLLMFLAMKLLAEFMDGFLTATVARGLLIAVVSLYIS